MSNITKVVPKPQPLNRLTKTDSRSHNDFSLATNQQHMLLSAAIDDIEIDPASLRVYVHLCALSASGRTKGTARTTAEHCDMSVSTLKRSIARLKELNLISIQDGLITLIDSSEWSAPVRKGKQPVVKNHPKKKGYRKYSGQVFSRDGYRCVYCGASESLTLDHVVPKSKGGADTPDNLVCCCHSCNVSKGTKSVQEWRAGR